MVTRFFTSLKIFLYCTAAAEAFSPVERSHLSRQSALCSMRPSKYGGDQECVKMPNRSDFLAVVGSLVTGAVMSNVQPAEAAVASSPSSSMFLSDEIKTIDMSLPSYDSVNTLKTDEKALGFEDVPESKQKSPPKKKSEGSSGGMGSLLPSMNKSGPSNKQKPTKVAKKPVEKAKKAPKEEKPKVEYETMDMALPSYSEGTAVKERSVFAL